MKLETMPIKLPLIASSMSHIPHHLPQWWLQEGDVALGLARQRPSPHSMSSRVLVFILQQDYTSILQDEGSARSWMVIYGLPQGHLTGSIASVVFAANTCLLQLKREGEAQCPCCRGNSVLTSPERLLTWGRPGNTRSHVQPDGQEDRVCPAA